MRFPTECAMAIAAAVLTVASSAPAAGEDTHCGARALFRVLEQMGDAGSEELRDLMIELDSEKTDGLLPFGELAAAARRRNISAGFVRLDEGIRDGAAGRLIVHLHESHFAVFEGMDAAGKAVLWMGPAGCRRFTRTELREVASQPALLIGDDVSTFAPPGWWAVAGAVAAFCVLPVRCFRRPAALMASTASSFLERSFR
jgi:hypothetical protein